MIGAGWASYYAIGAKANRNSYAHSTVLKDFAFNPPRNASSHLFLFLGESVTSPETCPLDRLPQGRGEVMGCRSAAAGSVERLFSLRGKRNSPQDDTFDDWILRPDDLRGARTLQVIPPPHPTLYPSTLSSSRQPPAIPLPSRRPVTPQHCPVSSGVTHPARACQCSDPSLLPLPCPHMSPLTLPWQRTTVTREMRTAVKCRFSEWVAIAMACDHAKVSAHATDADQEHGRQRFAYRNGFMNESSGPHVGGSDARGSRNCTNLGTH